MTFDFQASTMMLLLTSPSQLNEYLDFEEDTPADSTS